MRRGEALGLRWSDIDLSAGRCRVTQTVIQVGSKVSTSEPKTSSGRRGLSLDSATVAVLREHRRRTLEQRLLVGSSFTDNDLVFHHPDGASDLR
jgi:integrase